MNWDPSSLATLKQLEASLSSDLEAVRRLLSLAVEANNLLPQSPSVENEEIQGITNPINPQVPSPPIPPRAKLKVAALVRQVVNEMSGSFGIGDVKARVGMHSQRTFGDVAIRQQLKNMEQEGELVLTFQGLGRAGNQYAKSSRFRPDPLI